MEHSFGSPKSQLPALGVAGLSQNADQLCSFCSTLNFTGELARFKEEHENVLLGDGSKLLFTSSFPLRGDCAVCRLLYDNGVCNTGFSSQLFGVWLFVGIIPISQSSREALIAVDTRTHSDQDDSWIPKRAVFIEGDDLWQTSLVPVEESDYPDYELARKSAVPPYLTQESYTGIKAWLTTCESEHDFPCKSRSSLDASVHMVLIDCVELVLIRPRDDCPPYIALSYVWGKPKSGSSAIAASKDSSLGNFSVMPKTIQDAISATKALGYKYLWVDQYCIDQNSNVKASQIQMMDRIYAGAAVVLVVASGGDSDSGIPGISWPRKPSPPAQMSDGYRYVSRDTRPETEVASSKWATRGWTFQEGVLGCRRLMFTGRAVILECRTGIRCEGDLHWTYDDYHRGFFAPQKLELDKEKSSCDDFRVLLQVYSRRELTFNEDRLKAITGVLNSLCVHFEGLPYKVAGGIEEPSEGQCLAYFLDWMHAGPNNNIRRIESQLSISWAGWTGGIKIMSYGGHIVSNFPLFEVGEMYRAPIGVPQGSSSTSKASRAYLELSARSFGVALSTIGNDNFVRASGCSCRGCRLDLFASGKKILSLRPNDPFCDMMHLHSKGSYICIPGCERDRAFDSLSHAEGTLRAVLLSKDGWDSEERVYVLLLVATTGDGAFERIGLVHVHAVLDKGPMPTRMTWKWKWKWSGVVEGDPEKLEDASLERIRLV